MIKIQPTSIKKYYSTFRSQLSWISIKHSCHHSVPWTTWHSSNSFSHPSLKHTDSSDSHCHPPVTVWTCVQWDLGMRDMTASAEVTPYARLHVHVMQETLKLFTFSNTQQWAAIWSPLSLPNDTDDGRTDSIPQAGTKSLPQGPPLDLLSGVRLNCGTMWMLPDEWNVHRTSSGSEVTLTTMFLKAGDQESTCPPSCLTIKQVILFFNFKCYNRITERSNSLSWKRSSQVI